MGRVPSWAGNMTQALVYLLVAWFAGSYQSKTGLEQGVSYRHPQLVRLWIFSDKQLWYWLCFWVFTQMLNLAWGFCVDLHPTGLVMQCAGVTGKSTRQGVVRWLLATGTSGRCGHVLRIRPDISFIVSQWVGNGGSAVVILQISRSKFEGDRSLSYDYVSVGLEKVNFFSSNIKQKVEK